MHRSSHGLAAIWLAGWLAVARSAHAQEAKPTELPPIEVVAPKHRQNINPKPKYSVGGSRRSNRAAIQTPAPAVSAVAVTAATFALATWTRISPLIALAGAAALGFAGLVS